ncbi:TonB-dependent receptor [Brevundimonas sp. SORGH_AS_0993]|uniref:TonB-dependent receptor n=1 Tax=Brevundimonas sp. SORGH_AS_0993 TaxID=3041794 RepID=UPI00278A7C4F|nr:TonB-dependent receptor [Brevundimonas sp. SORGH_AS_0993]MDQ1154623.1 iron complex outermembrane receptor protein [Brevundimonas sp. SORGH_AS_0993]
MTVFSNVQTRRLRMLAAAAPILAAVTAGPALAQSPSAPQTAVVDDVVVTAAKRGDQRAHDVPLSITAFDGAGIEKLNVTAFDDLVVQVPGANFLDNGGPGRGNEVASIRGLSPVGDNTAGVVAQYLDGSPRTGNNYRLFDIGEVSVLRGPQGTLWGAQAVGGLVSIRSNRPSLSGFSAQAEGDAYATKNDGGVSNRFAGFVNLPLGDDFAVRVAGQRIDETGYIDNVATGAEAINDVKELGWRVSALYRPSDRFDATFIYHGDDLHTDAPSYMTLGLGDLKTDNPVTYRPADQRLDLFNLIVNGDLGWATLSYTGSRFELDNVYYDAQPDAFGIPGTLGWTRETLQQHAWTHELRLSSKAGERLGWIVGLYHDALDENKLSEQTEILNPIVPGDTPTYSVGFPLFTLGGPQSTRETAVFGELTYRLNDQWDVLAGGRYFDWSVDNQQQFTYFGSVNYQQATGKIGGEDSFYKLQVNYRPTKTLLLYALRSEGFRFGGFNPFVGPVLNIPLDFIKFDPDTLVNYEIGAKGSAFDGRLLYGGSAYSAEWKDVQTVVFNATGTFAFTTNAPSLEAKGFELEASTRDLFLRGLSLGANFAFTENAFTEDARVFPGVRLLVAKGDHLRRTPRNTWALNAGYDFDLGGHDAFVRANYWHRDASSTKGFDRSDGNILVPRQDVFNASAGLAFGPTEIKVYVNNLTDERPWLQIFPATVATQADIVSSIRPRTFGVQLTRRFGQ